MPKNPKMPYRVVTTHVESHLPPKVKRIEVYDERRGWGYKQIMLRGAITTCTQVTTIERGGIIRLYGQQGY